MESFPDVYNVLQKKEKMKRKILFVSMMMLVGLGFGEMVSLNISNPDVQSWNVSAYSTANAEIISSKFDIDSEKIKGTSFQVDFTGKGFQACKVSPKSLKVTGILKKVSVNMRSDMPKYGCFLNFKDGEGRTAVDKKKLQYSLPYKDIGNWKKMEFIIPADWVQPVQFSGIMLWNWDSKTVKAHPVFDFANLTLEVDIAEDVNKEDLLSMLVSSGLSRNVFNAPNKPSYKVAASTWDSAGVSGKLRYNVIEEQSGDEVLSGEFTFANKKAFSKNLVLDVKRYGTYWLETIVSIDGMKEIAETSRFAYVPKPNVLSANEKKYCPYGINIHGGHPDVAYQQIADLGFVWARDYSFNKEWLIRARGSNQNYEGWPFYRAKGNLINSSGLILLPVLMGMIGEHPEPNKEWTQNLQYTLLSSS